MLNIKATTDKYSRMPKINISPTNKILITSIGLSILSWLFMLLFESIGYEHAVIKVLTLVIPYGLPIGIIFVNYYRKHVWSSKKAGALVLVLLALPIFGYAMVGIQIPNVTTAKSVNGLLYDTTGKTIATYQVSMLFTARGSFSAETPIHIKANVWNCTSDRFLDYNPVIAFTNGYFLNNTLGLSSVPVEGYLSFRKISATEYYAEGDLVWHDASTSYLIMPRPENGIFLINETDIEARSEVVLNISPVADTLANRANQTMEQLTYAVIGFSVIMLQPIIAVLYPDPPRQPQKEHSPNKQQPASKKHQTQ